MSREKMPRLFELADVSSDGLFRNLEASLLEIPTKHKRFQHIEESLTALTPDAWQALKAKLTPHIVRKDSRGWQQVFDTLNEARAYSFLSRQGCTDLAFVPQSRRAGKETPDIRGVWQWAELLCEVKTINVSEDEVQARKCFEPRVIEHKLGALFFDKLRKTLTKARSQLNAHRSGDETRLVTFIVFNFDDLYHEHLQIYLDQLQQQAPCYLGTPEEVVFAFYWPSALEIVCARELSGELKWQEISRQRNSG